MKISPPSPRGFFILTMMGGALLLSSCLTPTGTQAPASLTAYGARGGAGSTGIHTATRGDTVYEISKTYNLPLRDLIALNNLSAPYKIPPGTRLKLPAPNEYTVRPNDTLNRISRLFDASVSEMARLNNLSDPYILKKGQVLRLPSAQPELEKDFAVNAPQPSFAGGPVEMTAPVKVAAVESMALPPPPGMEQATSLSPPALAPAAGFPPQPAPMAPASSAASNHVLVPPQPAVTAAPAPAQLQKTAAIIPSIAPKVPPRSSSRFMRPVEGKIISGFGPKDDGLHNDGINIKAPRGAPVRAAENGVVVYTGSELAGYGNLVLVRHEGRWMTAYAHLDKTLVKKGDTVKAGQSLGTVGATGQVDSPQLHFEVRKGTQAVNPVSYL